MEMGAGAAAALADVADGVSAVHVLAGDAGKATQVTVAGGDAGTMVDDSGASVAANEVGKQNTAVGWRHTGRPSVDPISTPLWKAPSPLNGSIRSPNDPVMGPS